MPQMANFGFKTPTGVSVTDASEIVLNATDKAQRVALLTNDSDEDIYLGFGKAAVLNAGGLLKASGGSITIGDGGITFLGDVYAICASGGKNLCILENGQ